MPRTANLHSNFVHMAKSQSNNVILGIAHRSVKWRQSGSELDKSLKRIITLSKLVKFSGLGYNTSLGLILLSGNSLLRQYTGGNTLGDSCRLLA
jgi:hypothetical protein